MSAPKSASKSAPKSAPKSASKSAPKSAPKSASKAKSAPKSKTEEPRVFTYDGMKKLDSIVWDLNTRATEAKIVDGKTERELNEVEKSSRLFSEKEQEEMMKTHGNFIIVNPRAGTKTIVDNDTGKEV
jgi:hypothetical protein